MVDYVPAQALREVFNAGRYHERAESGELAIRVRADRHADRAVNQDDPTCTRSQFIEYFDGDQRVAGAFLYRRPDGSIGGSGRPDPKLVVIDDGRELRIRP